MNNAAFILLTLLVGFCFPVMASSNGILGKSLGSPFIATLLVFQLGSLLLLLILAVKGPAFPPLAQVLNIKWTVWLGGCIVILNLVTFTVVPGKIGIANMVVLFMAGQLLASVVTEHYGLLGFTMHKINWQRLLGVLCLLAGIIMVKKY